MGKDIVSTTREVMVKRYYLSNLKEPEIYVSKNSIGKMAAGKGSGA